MNFRETIGFNSEVIPDPNIEPAAAHSLMQLAKLADGPFVYAGGQGTNRVRKYQNNFLVLK